MPQLFGQCELMVNLSLRVVGLVVAGSHLVRSWLTPGVPELNQLDADIQAFRVEVSRGQRLLWVANSALETCSRETEIQRLLVLPGILFLLIFWRRDRYRLPDAVTDESDSSDIEELDKPAVVPHSTTSLKQILDRGPVTPSALRLGAAADQHGGGSTNIGY